LLEAGRHGDGRASPSKSSTQAASLHSFNEHPSAIVNFAIWKDFGDILYATNILHQGAHVQISMPGMKGFLSYMSPSRRVLCGSIQLAVD